MRWLRRLFSGDGGLTNPDEGTQIPGPTSLKTESGITLTDERAMALSAVWSCVRLISETVGSLPVNVYRRTEDGREAATDHFLHDLFRVAPNASMTPLEFREALTMQLALWGNGYAHITRDSSKKPIALIPLRPDRVSVERTPGGVVYVYHQQRGDRAIAPENMFHLKGFSVEGIIGLSPLDYARHTMGISVSADKFASRSFKGAGRYRGFISVDTSLTDAQREGIRKMYEQSSVDEDKTWVFEAGARFNQVSMPPDVMQMIQSRQFQLGEIARIFRVPSHLINDTEKSTSWGTGIEQQNLGFLTYTIRPYLTRWESTISSGLLDRTERKRYFVEHNVEGLLRADSAARANFYATALQNGWMSRAEVRAKENLPRKDGTDDLTVQVNLTPVDMLERIANGNQNTPN